MLGFKMLVFDGVTPLKTNMAMKNPPLEDVFPIENRIFSIDVLVFHGVNLGEKIA